MQLDKAGAIAVDEWSKTTADNIWAVGDVTDRINLTPVAIMEGHCFADTEFGNKPRKADHRDVPSAVFCQPELANVGLTEEEARQTAGRGPRLHLGLPADEVHPVRPPAAHLHEADRRGRDRQGGRRATWWATMPPS